MNLKESKEGYMGGFIGRKGREEMYNYNIVSKIKGNLKTSQKQ